MSKTKVVMSVVTSVWLCLLLVVFTFTWVMRNSTPSFQQDDLKISTAGALVIGLKGDDNTDVVNINNVVGIGDFVFKQVSSQNGKNFLWLDFNPTLAGNPAVYKDVTEKQKANYIDTEFAIILDETLKEARYVYLHPDCSLTDNTDIDVAKAMRISLSYDVPLDDGSTENRTYIFGNMPEGSEGADENLDTYAVLPDAANKNQGNVSAVGQQRVYSFSKFGGYNGTEPDTDKCLFKIEPGEMKWIKMRIWLEGADEKCVETIAGQTFDMVLKFDSVVIPEG